MALNATDMREHVIEMLAKVEEIDKVGRSIPEVVVTQVEAVVPILRGRHRQLGTMTTAQQHMIPILIYVPVGSNPDDAEDLILAVWDSMVELFDANVSLGGSATRSNLQEYTTGWQTIAGTKCRVMRCLLEAFFARATEFESGL